MGKREREEREKKVMFVLSKIECRRDETLMLYLLLFFFFFSLLFLCGTGSAGFVKAPEMQKSGDDHSAEVLH